MYSYYIYILKCSDGSYYTGITNDLTRRFEEHLSGYKKYSYTYKRRPLTMEFYQEFNDVLQAIYFEKKIKGWTRAKKIALINGDGFEFYLNGEMLQTVKITIADHKGFDSAQPDTQVPSPIRARANGFSRAGRGYSA